MWNKIRRFLLKLILGGHALVLWTDRNHNICEMLPKHEKYMKDPELILITTAYRYWMEEDFLVEMATWSRENLQKVEQRIIDRMKS